MTFPLKATKDLLRVAGMGFLIHRKSSMLQHSHLNSQTGENSGRDDCQSELYWFSQSLETSCRASRTEAIYLKANFSFRLAERGVGWTKQHFPNSSGSGHRFECTGCSPNISNLWGVFWWWKFTARFERKSQIVPFAVQTTRATDHTNRTAF